MDVPRLDHGVIGNGRVLALVSPTSAIEWLCMPRFDAPSVFARLLDPKGGAFRVLSASAGELRGEQRYVRNTNVLETRFQHDGAAWEVVDFAPRLPHGWSVTAPVRVVRVVRPLGGTPRLRVEIDPRLDYARGETKLFPKGAGVEIRGPNGELLELETNLPASYVLHQRDFSLDQPIFFSLEHGRHASRPTLSSALYELDETVAGWRAWAQTCGLPLFASELVLRSALCLKLHAFEDTGAIIAATTTSVPEAMGTERTWDYRYCWLRDAAFVVEALRRMGHLEEGERFMHFLLDVAEAGPLQPLYAVDGARQLDEQKLGHLAGFGGNGHVRVGNAATEQRQHDLWGALVLCLHTMLTDPRIVTRRPASRYFQLCSRFVEEAIAAAPLPDTSIWEFRTKLRPYTFSRAMCWAAISRGAILARHFGVPSLAERWQTIADAERAVILERGFSAARGCFVQTLDGEHPDASNLLLPTIGLIDARDPRFVSTIDVYARTLGAKGYMFRYANEDDFGDTTSAFTICSFWWAEALALAGRLDEAIEVFQRVTARANPLGLFSEDIDPVTGALLGNFPQTYTHVGLVHAATTIGELLEARDGKVRAWT